MAKLPPIDLSGLLKLLKTEGKGELGASLLGKMGSLDVLREWDKILKGLDEIVPLLAEGAEISAIKGPVLQLGKSVAVMSTMASQVLSFVPGPIGIVCSFVNAIVCLCTIPFPMCIGGAFLELLGCIPGGKVAIKGGAKLAPKIEKVLLELLDNNKALRETIDKAQEIDAAVKSFAKRVPKKPKNNPAVTANKKISQAPEATTGKKLDINDFDYYKGASPSTIAKDSPYSILYQGDQTVRRSILFNNMETNMVGNPLANIYSHLW